MKVVLLKPHKPTMTLPFSLDDLKCSPEHYQSVEVRLTPDGTKLYINAQAAADSAFTRWVLHKLDVEEARTPKPYTRVVQMLGLEQHTGLVVMAAASVGLPDRVQLIPFPEGMPEDLEQTHILYGVVAKVKEYGLEHGLWPLLKCSAESCA